MKKTLLSIAASLLLAGGTASAQDWQEALKKAATEAADKATDGKLTQYALVGTWNYSAPGVKFEGTRKRNVVASSEGRNTEAISPTGFTGLPLPMLQTVSSWRSVTRMNV